MDKNKNPKDTKEDKERVVFLGADEKLRRQDTPKVLLGILILTIMVALWKTAVRKPDAFEVSMQKRIERNMQEERQIEERQKHEKLKKQKTQQ